MDTYRQLLQSLDFVQIPTTFPDLLFGDDIYRTQAAYIRQWLRRNPQSGELLNALLLAATSLEQLAAFEFKRAESNMRKATQRIQEQRSQLKIRPK